MLPRQIVALGVIGGICAAVCALVYRRSDLLTTLSKASPIVSIAMAVTLLILMLAIGLATPIESDEINDIFYALLMTYGLFLVTFGAIFHLHDPGYLTSAHRTLAQPFLVRNMGILHIATGIQCVLVGIIKKAPEPILVQIVVAGWGCAVLFLLRAYRNQHVDEQKITNPDISNADHSNPDHDKSANDDAVPFIDREASLRTPEFYFSITIPILFLTLYIFGDHE